MLFVQRFIKVGNWWRI